MGRLAKMKFNSQNVTSVLYYVIKEAAPEFSPKANQVRHGVASLALLRSFDLVIVQELG